MTMHIDIPAARLAPAQALVTRFARKAERLGMSGPALTVVREYQRIWIVSPEANVPGVRRWKHEVLGPYDGLPLCFIADRVEIRALDMVEIEVTGERPVIAGWRFAAVIEATEAGNLLRKHPDHVGDLPLRFRACTSECEHCNTSRRRSETFVVEELHDGVTHKAARYVQVGRSCLGDFTGNADPAAWLACYQWLRELATLGDDDGLGGWGSAAPVVPTLGFLTCVAAHVRLYGYVGASMARGRDLVSTGSEVMDLLTSTAPKAMADAQALRGSVTDGDRSTVDRALAWLGSDAAGDSEYIHNLRIHAASACVRPRGANMLASLIQAYRKHIGDMVERKKKTNEHLPSVAVKDRLRGLVVTLVRESGYETDFGWKHVFSFEDADGRAVLLRTTNAPRVDAVEQLDNGCWVSEKKIEMGQTYVLTGTVKALGEYKGRKQTEVERVAVDLWTVADEPVRTCTATKAKRAAKCPAQKLKHGEEPVELDTFAPAGQRCDVIGDGFDQARDPFAAFDCAA